MDDLYFEGSFKSEIEQVENLKTVLTSSINSALTTLGQLSKDWQDKDSGKYITEWTNSLKSSLEGVKSSCDAAVNSLNSIAAELNKGVS